jgi:hypothetical protein
MSVLVTLYDNSVRVALDAYVRPPCRTSASNALVKHHVDVGEVFLECVPHVHRKDELRGEGLVVHDDRCFFVL